MSLYPRCFWRLRRQIEALQAQVDYQQFQLIAAYLTLSGNIITTAVTAASYQEQIRTTFELIKMKKISWESCENNFLEAVFTETVLTETITVNQTRQLPPLQKSLSQSRHALAVLVGDFPNTRFAYSSRCHFSSHPDSSQSSILSGETTS